MIGGLGLPELVIILLVVLLIFGPKNLPKLGKAIGEGAHNLRDGLEDGGDVEIDDDDIKSDYADSKPHKKKAAHKEQPAVSDADADDGDDD